MDWLFPYHWAALMGTPADPMPWWPPVQPARAEAEYTGSGDVDLELTRTLFGVLAEQAACGICGAPLHRAVDVVRAHRGLAATKIVVTVRCRGRRSHRHHATVVERGGGLQFGQLSPA